MRTNTPDKDLVYHQDFPSIRQFRDLVEGFMRETGVQNQSGDRISWANNYENGTLSYRLLGDDIVLFYQDVEIMERQKICIHPHAGQQPHFLIKYIVDQNTDLTLDGHIRLSQGELFLCNSLWGHEVDIPGGYRGKILQVIFSQNFLTEFVPDTYVQHPDIYHVFRAADSKVILLPRIPLSLREHLQDICAILESTQPIRVSKIRLLQQFAKCVEDYFCYFLERREDDYEPLNDRLFRTKVLRFFRENLETDWMGLDILSAHLSISPSTLKRRFCKTFGSPPHSYFRYLQMQHAKELLHSKAHTVSEISVKMGFSSVSSFIRCFKKIHGHTPGASARRELI